MTTAARPSWVRLDTNTMTNPKIVALRATGKHRAIVAWFDCLFYAAEHLTDGWLPETFPTMRGHKPADMQALIDVGLIHRIPVDGSSDYLIHDYLAYQPSRQYWIGLAEKKRKAARARWEDG